MNDNSTCPASNFKTWFDPNPPQPQWTNWWLTWPNAVSIAPTCDHCFCKPADFHFGVGPHKMCCKCGSKMAAKFLRRKK